MTGEMMIRAGFFAVIALLFTTVLVAIGSRESPREGVTPEDAANQKQADQIAELRRLANVAVNGVRDFMINNRPDALENYNRDLDRDKEAVDKLLAEIKQGGANQQLLGDLNRVLGVFWGVMYDARPFTAEQKSREGFDFIRKQVFVSRNAVFAAIKKFGDLNAAEHERIASHLDRRRRGQLGGILLLLGLSLIFSLLLAFASLRYRSHLQRTSVVKLNEIARARDDLEQLSGRLLRVQEEERRRLSRELHDGIGQTLTALRMEIHYAHLNGADSGERLERARMLAEEAVRTVKDISLLLRPPLLDDLGLEPAIRWQTDQFTRRTGIPCRLRAVGLQEQLPDDVKTCVFRVVQEALNNCEKHASPTQVQIVVEQGPDALAVQVEDNGAGFALSDKNTPMRNAGLGILGMRERAGMLGGSLVVHSAPGLGTRLHLTLPLARMSVVPPRPPTITMPPPALEAAKE